MPKRKSDKPLPKLWSFEQLVLLLSWLDHTIEFPEIKFQDTVVARLQGEYTWKQVESKLYRLQSRHGPYPVIGTKGCREIYTLGSACLMGGEWGLGEEYQEAIASARKLLRESAPSRPQEIKLQMVERQLRSQSRNESVDIAPDEITDASRDGRSATIECKKNAPPALIKKDDDSGQHSRKNTRKRLNTYSKLKSLAGANQSDKDRNSATTSVRVANRQRVRVQHNVCSPAAEDSTRIVPGAAPLLDLKAKSKQDRTAGRKRRKLTDGKVAIQQEKEIEGSSTTCSRCSLAKAPQGDDDTPDTWAGCDKCNAWDHVGCFEHLCLNCASQNIKAQTDVVDPQRQVKKRSRVDISVATQTSDEAVEGWKLKSARSEIEELRYQIGERDKQIADQNEENEDKDRMISQMKFARDQVTDPQKRLAGDALVELKEKVHKLEKELDEKTRLGIFSGLRGSSRDRFGETSISKAFIDIYAQSKQLSCFQEGACLPFTPLLRQNRDLQTLVTAISAKDTDGVPLEDEMMARLAQANPQAAIRTLTASAIREWIFRSTYPILEADTLNDHKSEVLQSYRNIIYRQGGALPLRNLDLCALDSYVKDVAFRNIRVPKEAAAMAVRFTQTLAPWFSNTPGASDEEDFEGFATWRHDEEACKEKKQRLHVLFELALITKADSCLNMEYYEMVIFPPGTEYDHLTMTVETNEGMPDTTSNHANRRVLICVEAAIFAYPRELQAQASMLNALMTTDNFVTKRNGERGKVRPLVKAIVVLS